MSWLVWLTLALVIAAVAAVTGIKPKDTRPVSRTKLMGVARFVLVALCLVVAYVAFQARAGG